jgi:hypothetical protein
MAGLDPAIQTITPVAMRPAAARRAGSERPDPLDGRVKPGHDGGGVNAPLGEQEPVSGAGVQSM